MRLASSIRSLVVAAFALVSAASAQSTFTWTQTAGGAQGWATAGNWSPVAIPSPVSGDTVDFSTVNIAANTTLTLGADRAATLWKFGDTSSTTVWTAITGTGTLSVIGDVTPPTLVSITNNKNGRPVFGEDSTRKVSIEPHLPNGRIPSATANHLGRISNLKKS